MKKVIELVEKNHGKEGKELIIKAHKFMKEAHKGQKRADGSPFHTHPEEVAKLLAEKGHTDPILLSAALLHDVAEDTEFTLADIKNEFGDEITFLVDGATDYGKGDGNPPVNDRYDRMKLSQEKIISYGSKDPRLFLIKSADRIHNLKTMKVLSKDRQKRLAKEAKEFHKPALENIGEKELAEMISHLVEEL